MPQEFDEFDPMRDLERALDRARRRDEPKPDDAPPVLGVLSATIYADDAGGIFDACDRAGGHSVSLQIIEIPPEMAEHQLACGVLTQQMVYTRTGWYLVVGIDEAPSERDHAPRYAVVPVKKLSHAMWHMLSGSRCTNGDVKLPADVDGAQRDPDGTTAFEHVRRAHTAIMDRATAENRDAADLLMLVSKELGAALVLLDLSL